MKITQSPKPTLSKPVENVVEDFALEYMTCMPLDANTCSIY